MTADELLTKLEKSDLVAPEIIATLRRQVAASKDPVPPSAVTKLLVDKGHLTANQAARLEQTSASQIAKQPAAPAVAAAAPVKAVPLQSSSVHDDLGLAALDELDAPSPAASASQKKTATPTAAKSAVKVAPAKPPPSLDDLGLAPLDELDAPTPAAPAQKPAAASLPVAKPLAKAAPAKAPPSLDDLGLAPLDDLSPAAAPATAPTPAAKSTIQKAAPAAPQKAVTQKASPQPSAIQKAAAAPAVAATGLADLPALDDLSTLDDLQSLDGLSSLGDDPLSSGGLTDLGALATQTAAPVKAQITPATVTAPKAASESRTTLFVGLGIGGAALLVIVIGLALFLWPRGDGAIAFQAAEQAYQEKQYAAASEKYDAFLRLHPRHEQASLVRVHRGMCAIQLANVSPPNWPQLLPVFSNAADDIAAEPALGQIHAELAPLLVSMTEGLAEVATSQKVDQQTPSRLQQARAALALCNDTRLLPSTLRPWQKLADIEDRLQLVSREVNKATAREQAKSAVSTALTSGNLSAALQARSNALAKYPELASDELWTELAPEFATAATSSAKLIAEKKAAERDPLPSPIKANFPWQLLNARLQPTPPPASEQVLLFAAAGAVHALDQTTGQARWSRYLANSDWPLTSADGKRTWLIDRQQNELLSVTTSNGNLLWRQPLPSNVAGAPLMVRDKLYVSLASGKVLTLDSNSGELQSTLELPQPLLIGPVAASDSLWQLGDEGLLYKLSLAEQKCSAIHLGFERGTARFPPLSYDRRVVVASRRGDQTELCLITDEAKPTIKRQRIAGVIAAPLTAQGKTLFIATTDGKLQLLEPADGNEPFKIVQTIPPAAGPRVIRQVQATRGGVLAADRGLALLKLDAAGKVQTGWNIFAADLFDSSGSQQEETILATRYAAEHQTLIAAKVNAGDGVATWQSPLNPPLMLLADKEEDSLPIAIPSSAVAKLLTLDATADLNAAFKQILSQPIHSNLKTSPLGDRLTVGDEQLIAPLGSRELLFVKPADFSVRKLPLPGSLAGRPAVAGQNLLVPLSDGSIQCLSAASGEIMAAPFMLPNASNSVAVIALDDGGQSALVSDGSQTIVRIGLSAEPKPHWSEQAAVRLQQPLAAPPATLAEVVFAADRRGQLQVYSLPELTAGTSVDLKGGQVNWGPHRVGDCVLLATDRDELWCCDATRQPRWQQPLSAGHLIGPPLVQDGKLIVTTASGTVEVRSAGSGEIMASANTRQPLAGSALLSGKSLWLTTNFGQVIQMAIPTEMAQ
ncbi:outer membrane protein assembly factor BamB family protein [Anatilimnocola floriformis]|uniref:outer membrane protein assembly factor BamB family protein n=1 Tax=Anatilimnocola floriformis TaxID=2948575 RepID=UPI0020C3402B|nr:PQQ-binding-like beta-propeller repeat protein [Anatilimnocola floriformis]